MCVSLCPASYLRSFACGRAMLCQRCYATFRMPPFPIPHSPFPQWVFSFCAPPHDYFLRKRIMHIISCLCGLNCVPLFTEYAHARPRPFLPLPSTALIPSQGPGNRTSVCKCGKSSAWFDNPSSPLPPVRGSKHATSSAVHSRKGKPDRGML